VLFLLTVLVFVLAFRLQYYPVDRLFVVEMPRKGHRRDTTRVLYGIADIYAPRLVVQQDTVTFVRGTLGAVLEVFTQDVVMGYIA
jgi:hypothetical protein